MSLSGDNGFDIISSISSKELYPEIERAASADFAIPEIRVRHALRERFPELCVVAVPMYNAPVMAFAQVGYAQATLDTETDQVLRYRGYILAVQRGQQSGFYDSIMFAKYHYQWADEDFIVFVFNIGTMPVLFVLKEPGPGENTRSNCAKIDALIKAASEAFAQSPDKYIYVFDGYWMQSNSLWKVVQETSWDDVVLDEGKKKALMNVTSSFFNSKDDYKKYGVPWKRGVIWHGPPGNGKTLSIRAMMHALIKGDGARMADDTDSGDAAGATARANSNDNTAATGNANTMAVKPRLLYVKSAPNTYAIGAVFSFARSMAPCLLVMEDIETIVKQDTRSYFFNEVDGLENNDGILMLATTNYLDRLDPGLAKRPSRFDRKYLFPLPDKHERTLYAALWQHKLSKTAPSIAFPDKLCPAIADITQHFSFAYMQEAFVATLLAIARDDSDGDDDEDAYAHCESDLTDAILHAHAYPGARARKDLDHYRLWRVMKVQVKILREDLDSSGHGSTNIWDASREAAVDAAAAAHAPSMCLGVPQPSDMAAVPGISASRQTAPPPPPPPPPQTFASSMAPGVAEAPQHSAFLSALQQHPLSLQRPDHAALSGVSPLQTMPSGTGTAMAPMHGPFAWREQRDLWRGL